MAAVAESKHDDVDPAKDKAVSLRQPAIFVNHGAGPMPYLRHIGKLKENRMDSDFMIGSLQRVSEHIEHYKPKAVCIVSAHWEEATPTVLYQKSPKLLYDYGGFGKEAFEIKYPAPCSLQMTDRVVQLLTESGHPRVLLDLKRGYDHGLFIPMIIAAPNADIPLIQVSLHSVTRNRQQTARNNLRCDFCTSKVQNVENFDCALQLGRNAEPFEGRRSDDHRIGNVVSQYEGIQ